MTVKSGKYVVRRNGVEVKAEGSWKLGPAISSVDVAGADATLEWPRTEPVTVLDRDYTEDDYDGDPVEIDWVDERGTTRVFTGRVSTTAGSTLSEAVSKLTDGTERLSRTLDLRPMAYTLPVHPILSGHGGRPRHVGLMGTWFTHQAMVHSGFDPGVPMHWSAVWYQSMCGSVATVPDRTHAFASLGDLRQARRLSDPDLAPGFPSGENQIVAEDVFTFGVTSPPRPNSENLPWQLTWDLPIDGGNDGELVLRNLETSAGLAVKWSTNNMSFYKHNATGTQDLLGTVVRDRSSNGDKRWSVVAAPSGSTVIVRTDARGEVARWEGAGTVHPLPTGKDGLCTLRTSVPGKIGATAVTRGDRHYMTTEPPKGRILRGNKTATTLPGWPSLPGLEAGRILSDQADAHRGLRGQPLWQWIDHNGLLINTDFDTLAARPVQHTFDTRPDSGALALDSLSYQTQGSGGPWSAVEVVAKRFSVARRDRPTLLLAQGSAQGLQHGDDYEAFLTPEPGTTWLEPDLRPLMAGWPYPSPPYDPRYKNNLNREEKSWVGGHRFFREGGERRGWLHPYQMSWTVDAAGHVVDAMRQIDPDTVVVEGKAVLPQGPPVQDASTSPDPGSQGLWSRRKDQPFPQLRGFGLMTELEARVELIVPGVDDRHPPLRHDTGYWIQSNTGMTRIGEYLHDNVVRPTPLRTAEVEQTGWVKAGEKVRLRERRRNGYIVEEDIVVTPVEGSTFSSSDSMFLTGVVVARRVIRTDPDAPPVDEEEEWVSPPPEVIPEPPRGTDPPPREDYPPAPGEPPLAPPAKPSTPELGYDAHGLLTVVWDGRTSTGTPAVGSNYGSTEVALDKQPLPEEVIGLMWEQDDASYMYTEPSIDYGSEWYVRIRVVDRWGQTSEWSEVAGPVEVVPLVDPEQFDDLRKDLDEAAGWIADTGAELDQRLDDAELDLSLAEDAIEAAEGRLDAAELELGEASTWIAGTGAQLGTNLAAAQGMLDAAFPSGPFDVGGAIDAAVAGVGGNTTTYSNIAMADKPGPAPTSTVGRKSGDIHRNRSQSTGEVYAEWMLGANGTWQSANFGDSILRSLDVGKITGGVAAFVDFVSQNLTSNTGVINELWTEVVRSRMFTTDMMVVGSGSNLIPWNATTADALSIHQGHNGYSLDPYNINPHSGSACCYASGGTLSGTGWDNVVQFRPYLGISTIEIEPDQEYLIGVWVRAGGSYPDGRPDARVAVWFYDENNAYVSNSSSAGDSVPVSWGGWDEVSHVVKAPENARRISIRLQMSGVSGNVMVDDPYMKARDAASLVVDGGITAKKITITGDENNPDEAGLVANIASIMELDVGNLVALKGTIDEGVINELWTKVVRSQKITTDMLLVGSGVNMVVDPGFLDPDLNAYRASLSTGNWSYALGPSPHGGTNRFRTSNNTVITAQLEVRANDAPGNVWAEVDPGETYRIRYRAVQTSAASATTRAAIRYRRADGTLGFVAAGAYTAVERDLTKITTAWQEFTWTAPADAVSASLAIQVQGTSSGAVDIVSPAMTVSGASLVVEGTIDARHINAESIAAEIGEFVKVKANNIEAGLVEATLTISGRIQTATRGPRVIIDGTGIQYLDAFDSPLFSADYSGVYVAGDLRTDGANGIQIITDGSKYGNAIMRFRHSAYTLANSPYVALEYDPSGGTIPTTVMAGANGANGKAFVALAANGNYARIHGKNNIFLDSDEVTAEGVYSKTTTGSANVIVSLLGSLRRTTSLSSAKAMIEPLADWQGVKELEPVTYYDRANLELLSSALWAKDEDALEAVEHLTKWIGLTAEQAAESGSGLATYDSHGHLNGVAYDRLAVALLPWLHELERRINNLEENGNE